MNAQLAGLNEYLRFIVTLTAVVDPFLAVPFFLAFDGARTEPQRRELARVIAITVFSVLAVSAIVGESLLLLVGASLPAFRVGGGLVLLLMALAMLNAQAGGVRQSKAEARELQSGEVGGVVPLAFPLLAGPGAISTTIISAEKGGVAHVALLLGCIALVCLLTWWALRQANSIADRLGVTGLNIATRILGLLLAAMAVQTMAEGLKALFPGLAA
jgi:multiple antibiotic resistance protein